MLLKYRATQLRTLWAKMKYGVAFGRLERLVEGSGIMKMKIDEEEER